jgi:cytochrome P450
MVNLFLMFFVKIDQTMSEITNGSTVDSFVRHYMLASAAEPVTSSVSEKSEGTNEMILSQDELVFTVRDLVTAGTDTSVQTLRWTLVELVNHRQVQSRLQKEIDDVIGSDRLPSLDDEASMPYTQAVILEVMRRRTLVPRALLHRTRCDTDVGQLFVPADSVVNSRCYTFSC